MPHYFFFSVLWLGYLILLIASSTGTKDLKLISCPKMYFPKFQYYLGPTCFPGLEAGLRRQSVNFPDPVYDTCGLKDQMSGSEILIIDMTGGSNRYEYQFFGPLLSIYKML
ncbi:hypothetical protein L211DRAFT_645300 [Terfezia boudieri ATCC MYA-4762]|uniref:Uncharacterized protein n=1 Tax=Terfezia boudieri ATCC MYA-4762 TaxID=1051890 RepID=A0A3N4LUR2_9PEZI|nr:hypothetical protein L211DRAFT_645300 [Terfezia boudieri ATCC MYA-4762]